jgi:hypothetical protein
LLLRATCNQQQKRQSKAFHTSHFIGVACKESRFSVGLSLAPASDLGQVGASDSRRCLSLVRKFSNLMFETKTKWVYSSCSNLFISVRRCSEERRFC